MARSAGHRLLRLQFQPLHRDLHIDIPSDGVLEAGGISGCEECLGVGRLAGASKFTRQGEVEIEPSIGAFDVALPVLSADARAFEEMNVREFDPGAGPERFSGTRFRTFEIPTGTGVSEQIFNAFSGKEFGVWPPAGTDHETGIPRIHLAMQTTSRLTTPISSSNCKRPLSAPAPASAAPVPFFRRPRILLAAMITLPPVFALTAWLVAGAMTRQSTDDAFVDGNTVFVAPRVAGKVIALSVNDNELVQKGAPLFEIDPADFAARVEQDKQAVAVAKASADSKEAAYQEALAHVETARGFASSAQASVEQAQADATRLQDDLVRERALVETKVISKQEYDDAAKTTLAALAAARSKIAQQNASVSYENESSSKLASAKADWESARAQVGQAKAALAESQLQLSYTQVVAPATGRVTQRSINVGNYLQVGQQVMALVPPDVWITANFKETQLKNMRPGQPAEIRVDAYPNTVLQGHVDSIQAGSGAAFSLLPPENATGNYVKVVQRVPVKIVLDEPDSAHVLGPGMSVEPSVLVNSSRMPFVWAGAAASAAALGVVVFGILRLRHNAH
jgi:membrane fusion protein (multidrug efflux system)